MVTEEERLDIGMAYYEDGFNEGLRKTQFEIAQKMLQKGFPIEEICELLGLSEQAVAALQQ